MAFLIAHKKMLRNIRPGMQVYNERSGTWGEVLGWQDVRGERVRCHVKPLPKWPGHTPRETWWDTASLHQARERGEG